MVQTPVYMDNHATTPVDPRVLEAMLPMFGPTFGNPGSASHVFGWDAKDAVDAARKSIAADIGAKPREIIFTSGATESNNLAIFGIARWQSRKGNHLVTVRTEHKAVLDPMKRLDRSDFEITYLPVEQAGSDRAGLVDPRAVADAIRDDTILVSVMAANNEIGAIQPIAQIGRICRERGVLFHCDATQAVGRTPVDVDAWNVDLMSFSGHKIYGPKGVGALYRRRARPGIRLHPIIEGGGQESGARSGTLNTPGIVGLATALRLCVEELPDETTRLRTLRDRLFAGLVERVGEVTLNGPSLELPDLRLPGNLSVQIARVDGESLMTSMRELAVSAGSACTSVNPEPSHVLRALGLGDDQIRSSLRFGLGRFNTSEEVDFAVETVKKAAERLRKLSSL